MQCGISGRSIEHGLRALKSQGSCSRARCFLVFLCKWSGGSLIWEEYLRQNFTCRGGISSAFTSLGRGEHAEAGSPLSHVGERTSVSWNRAKEKNILLIITHYRFGQRIVDFFFFSIWVAQTLGKFHHINSQFTVLGGSPEAGTLKLVLLNFHPKPNRLVIFSHPLNLIK